ncbi:phospholipase D-like domain-containing protein [Mycolicibacterium senegalense]|uniref:phospholipase D-like domain-containing protein n=1 Tax=Mycolicibacterium senegalense TaxID=1796 RepID=UPI003AAF3774
MAGTHVVSFGIRATATARRGLLGFSLRRADGDGDPEPVLGYKVFQSLTPRPSPRTKVDTWDHPVQSLIWDDFYARPGKTYHYWFYPFRGTPQDPQRGKPVTITVCTEPASGGVHDVYFNRGVTGSQSYAIRFDNLPPEKQPSPKKRAEAYEWLSRNLDEALLEFIDGAQPGDKLRGCFYEFTYGKALSRFTAAHRRGVDVRLIVDMKENEHYIKTRKSKPLPVPLLVPSSPREHNLHAIRKARLPKSCLTFREARKDDIQHNKFLVLVRGGRPIKVWTGSTNLTDGGIFGQANVGHVVRDGGAAGAFLDYWTLLSGDPGGPTSAVKNADNVAFRRAVDELSPLPKSRDDIPVGVTPIFSPRSSLDALDLYCTLLAHARRLSCGTFPFTLDRSWREPLVDGGRNGRLCYLLLDKPDRTKPTKDHPEPVITLDSTSHVYQAYGSELGTPLGQWIAETNNIELSLNQWVSYIHLKFILSDPLGADPIVVTGSANFSRASTLENDENMLLIRGDRRVADIYFTEFNRMWGHYYFRSVVERTQRDLKRRTPTLSRGEGRQFLSESPAGWLSNYEPGDLRTKRVNQYLAMAL